MDLDLFSAGHHLQLGADPCICASTPIRVSHAKAASVGRCILVSLYNGIDQGLRDRAILDHYGV